MKNVLNKVVMGEVPQSSTIDKLAIGQLFRFLSSGDETPNVYIKTDQRAEDGVSPARYRIVNLKTGSFYTPSVNNEVVALTKPVTIIPGQGN